MTKVRWNQRKRVWQFYEKAWGGWCVLRRTGSNASPPMEYAEGFMFVANRMQLDYVLVGGGK